MHTIKIGKGEFVNYLQKGISYSQYKQNMAMDLELNPDFKIKEYIKLNQSRMRRVEKTFTPSAILAEQIKNLKYKSYWLVLTEHWCGDASQNLPVFNSIAELSQGKIEMKLIYRDNSDEIMNEYLTNGTRSIPKLIQLDEHYNVTGIWGPRPTEAQKLVINLKSNPATAASYANDLHLWYATDKNQILGTEISKLLYKANLVCPDCLL